MDNLYNIAFEDEKYEKVLGKYNEIFEVLIDLANKSYKSHEYENSIRHYKEALDLSHALLNRTNDERKNHKKIIHKLIDSLKNGITKSYMMSAKNHIESLNYYEALNEYKNIIIFGQDSSFIYYQIGICYKGLLDYDLAIKYFNKSLKKDPERKESYLLLGELFFSKNDYQKSIINYEIYIKQDKNNAYVYNMLGHLYHRSHDVNKSLSYFEKAIDTFPGYQAAISNFIFTLSKIPKYNQKIIYLLTKSKVKDYLKYIAFQKNEIFKHKKNKKNKKIKIGYLSGDFRNHVVMSYILPILENHDKEKFSIYCYSNNESDTITDICKKYISKFYYVKHLDDYTLAEFIFRDGIDILVDLSGHTAGNRIFTLRYKPAPVQVMYIGFPNTTGIKQVDYFLTNKILNEPEEEKYFSEKLYFIDWVYRCFTYYNSQPPEFSTLPYIENGFITFGVFNDLSKINDSVLKTWSVILKSVKNSKLLICRDTLIQSYYYEKFLELGIESERLIFINQFSYEVYNKVDIHLDTFPYCGVTVVFDSIFMGVPVITLFGEVFQGREASNINYHLNLDYLVSYNMDDYINKAISLSDNIKLLIDLRSNLRRKLTESDFYNYKDFTAKLEVAYIDMYNKFHKIVS